jgi:hypothetical protein
MSSDSTPGITTSARRPLATWCPVLVAGARDQQLREHAVAPAWIRTPPRTPATGPKRCQNSSTSFCSRAVGADGGARQRDDLLVLTTEA